MSKIWKQRRKRSEKVKSTYAKQKMMSRIAKKRNEVECGNENIDMCAPYCC